MPSLNNRRYRPQGFTIIELMIVLTVISVLTIVAIPGYQKFAVRTQVAEGINLIKPFRYAMTDYYIQNGNWPDNNLIAGMNPPESYATLNVERISIAQNGANANIIIEYKIPALSDDNTLIFYTVLDNGRIHWHCDSGTINNLFRPVACQDE
jgi:prepilin-type N-terminal cleavage/methylation domain-containing protein